MECIGDRQNTTRTGKACKEPNAGQIVAKTAAGLKFYPQENLDLPRRLPQRSLNRRTPWLTPPVTGKPEGRIASRHPRWIIQVGMI